eukprot:6553290-Prorocentrum_lima.AAC.1
MGLAMGGALYQRLGNNTASAMVFFEELMNDANLIYETQLHIILTISDVFILTEVDEGPAWNAGQEESCPGISDQLNWFREWVSGRPSQGLWHLLRDCRKEGNI